MSDGIGKGEGASPRGIASRVIEGWALAGGLILLLVVLMNAYSVVAQQFGGSFPGDFEMTQMGVAVAAFAFLPYCQLTGSHVTADIFTSGASPVWIGRFQLMASVAALAFACLLLWRMYAGMLDQREYNYFTTILAVPHWWAYIPILFSLALWIWACVITLRISAGHAMRR
ncbi:MAG: TRAP transporter small permease [Hyphomicrobiales bacterium]|nr:TRAP transporter small permease [Hyphomicrobiales bacterium]